MRSSISGLIEEHKKISEELTLIEGNFSSRPAGYLQDSLKRFKGLESLAIHGHHKKEDEILFSWMLAQDRNADRSVIERFRKEHEELETLHKGIIKNLEMLLEDPTQSLQTTVEIDAINFIDSYREHIQKEESFIFVIADGIIAANEKRKEAV